MLVTFSGIDILFRALQPEKAWSAMVVTYVFLSKLIVVRAVQPEKA